MINFIKKNVFILLVTVSTVILAGIAVFTAIRLYQLRRESVTPGSPVSRPKAEDELPPASQSCTLNFAINPAPTATITPTPTSGPSPTPTRIPSGTPSPTNTPTNTPVPTQTVTPSPTNSPSNTPVPSSTPNPTATATSIPNPTDTSIPNPTATNTPNPTATSIPGSTSTPQPTQALAQAGSPSTASALPAAGISTPTLLGLTFGIILVLGAILLAI